jgi:hypothetical protein
VPGALGEGERCKVWPVAEPPATVSRRLNCHLLPTRASSPPPHTQPPHPQGEATVPSLLGEELDTNPFLRPADPEIRAAVGAGAGDPDWRVFGAVRAAKDAFRG